MILESLFEIEQLALELLDAWHGLVAFLDIALSGFLHQLAFFLSTVAVIQKKRVHMFGLLPSMFSKYLKLLDDLVSRLLH